MHKGNHTSRSTPRCQDTDQRLTTKSPLQCQMCRLIGACSPSYHPLPFLRCLHRTRASTCVPVGASIPPALPLLPPWALCWPPLACLCQPWSQCSRIALQETAKAAVLGMHYRLSISRPHFLEMLQTFETICWYTDICRDPFSALQAKSDYDCLNIMQECAVEPSLEACLP